MLIIPKNQITYLGQPDLWERIQMARKGVERSSRSVAAEGLGCCKVESVVSVDERGQMVLPKDVREKAGVRVGDKFAVVSWEKQGRVCCISLVKVEDMASMVQKMLGPMISGMLQK